MNKDRNPQHGTDRQHCSDPAHAVPLQTYLDALRELALMEEDAASRRGRHSADDPGVRER